MRYGIPQVIIAVAVYGCGETVNFETQEKLGRTADAAQADSQVESGADSGAAGTDGSIDPAADPLALCLTAERQTQDVVLAFPEIAAGTTCSFDQGENLSRKNGFIRAYARQDQSVNLPTGAVLCGFTLDHTGQSMRYDDEMLFLINERILMATKDYTEYFKADGNLRTFDWNLLKDKVYAQNDSRPLYCVGGSEGLSSCKLPMTETSGKIELTFAPELSQTLAKALIKDQELKFSWITTGDNDDSDCRHSAVTLRVGLQYIVP